MFFLMTLLLLMMLFFVFGPHVCRTVASIHLAVRGCSFFRFGADFLVAKE